MRTFILSFAFLASSAFASHHQLIASYTTSDLRRSYSCTISVSSSSNLYVKNVYIENGDVISERGMTIGDSSNFVSTAEQLLYSVWEESNENATGDWLRIVSVHGMRDGREVSTPLVALGKRQVRSLSPLAEAFTTNIIEICDSF
jgi:hypothetical protein